MEEAFGKAALGFCGLAPGRPRRERKSTAAPCASMTSSTFGWHPLASLAERLRTSRRVRSRPPARRAWLQPNRKPWQETE